jgi:hypothetical protein
VLGSLGRVVGRPQITHAAARPALPLWDRRCHYGDFHAQVRQRQAGLDGRAHWRGTGGNPRFPDLVHRREVRDVTQMDGRRAKVITRAAYLGQQSIDPCQYFVRRLKNFV